MQTLPNVTVTATLDDADAVWPDPLPAGWTAPSAAGGDVSGVLFGYVACTPVSPVNPVIQATCTAGAVTVPTVVAASSPTGVTYVVDPAGPYDAEGGDAGDGDGDVG